MTLWERLKIVAAIFGCASLVYCFLYFLTGSPAASDESFFGAVLPISIGGGIVIAIVARQLIKRHGGHEQ